MDHNPELEAMLEKSIAKAKEINPDKKSNPAQSLEEYYAYIEEKRKGIQNELKKSESKYYINS